MNSYLFDIKDTETLHFAKIHTTKHTTRLLVVGDEKYPCFNIADSRQKLFLVYVQPINDNKLIENGNKAGFDVVEILDFSSLVPIVKALGKKYPNSDFVYAYSDKAEKRLVEKYFEKLFQFPC